MKNSILLFFLFAAAYSQGQIIPSDCTVPSVLIENYDWDIKGLAVDRMFSTNHPDKDKVEIPQIIQDSIAEGLAAILHAVELPQRDSIFNMYCIHNGAFQPITKSIIVSVDNSYAWTGHWENLEITTGEPLLDYITSKYELKINSFTSFAVLETPHLWNINALCDSLELVDGINYAEPNSIIGGGGRITYTADQNGFKDYAFSFEWNDCFDGCDNRHTWFYKVHPNCNVEFLGVEDFGFFGEEPLPDPINCNISTSLPVYKIVDFYSIFPNPTASHFSIINTRHDENIRFNLLSITGQTLKTGIQNVGSPIDISNFEPGLYFIEIMNKDNEVQVLKLVIL